MNGYEWMKDESELMGAHLLDDFINETTDKDLALFAHLTFNEVAAVDMLDWVSI